MTKVLGTKNLKTARLGQVYAIKNIDHRVIVELLGKKLHELSCKTLKGTRVVSSSHLLELAGNANSEALLKDGFVVDVSTVENYLSVKHAS